MELGTSSWITAAQQAINRSDAYRDRAAEWQCSLGLAFLGDQDRDTHHVVLHLEDGRCRSAEQVAPHAFQAATFRLSAPYERWLSLLQGRLDPMRCLVLKRVRLDGDRLTAMRYLPALKALVDALATIDAEAPAA